MKRTFASIGSTSYSNPSVSFHIAFDTLRRCKRLSCILRTRSSLRSWHPSYPSRGLLSWTRRGAPWEESFTRRTAVLACFRGNRKQASPKFYWRAIVSHKAGGSPLLRSARGIYQRVSRYLGPRLPPSSPPRVSLSRAFVEHSAIGLD